MVDEPDTGEGKLTSEQKSVTLPTPSRTEQGTNFDQHKYRAKYIVRPIYAIRRGALCCVRFFDNHSGSFSALASLFIVVLTYFYVSYSGAQWRTMQRQMSDSEAIEAASIAIKDLAIKDFPDKAEVVFDLVNEGRTRGDLIGPGIYVGRISPKEESRTFGQEHVFGMIKPSINGFSLSPSDPPRHISWRLLGLYAPFPKEWNLPPAVLKDIPTKEQLVKGDPVTLYVTVEVGYLDIFGNARQTLDCLVWNPRIKLFEPCIAQHDRHY